MYCYSTHMLSEDIVGMWNANLKSAVKKFFLKIMESMRASRTDCPFCCRLRHKRMNFKRSGSRAMLIKLLVYDALFSSLRNCYRRNVTFLTHFQTLIVKFQVYWLQRVNSFPPLVLNWWFYKTWSYLLLRKYKMLLTDYVVKLHFVTNRRV